MTASFCRLRTMALSSAICSGVTVSVLLRISVEQNSICWMSRLSMSSSSISSANRSRPPLNSSYMRAQSTTATMLSSASLGSPPTLASSQKLEMV